jgi:hypothetical protein
LGLRDWPFRVVPDENAYATMADRAQFRADIQTLLRNLSRRSASSIHLMWAWYGSGKTHSLRHIQYLCGSMYRNITPIYHEFPRGAGGFLHLYQEFISRLPIEVINNAYLEVFTSPHRGAIQRQLSLEMPDLANGLKLLYMGTSDQQNIVFRWLRAECRETRLLRTVGIARPVSSAEDCLRIVAWLVKLINLGASLGDSEVRVLWMIDEFQRISDCRRPAREEINGALNAVFNRCPNSLSIILSFSGRPNPRLPDWVSDDLADRIGTEKVLLLPPLIYDDAITFIRDLLHYYREPGMAGLDPWFPFTAETVSQVVNIVGEKTELKPRALMHFFNAVLAEADPLIEGGSLNLITPDFASRVLEHRIYLEQEE